MRLRLIREFGGDMSRRDFVKKSAGAVLSASPLGKLLLSSGIAPKIAEKIISTDNVPFVVWTHTTDNPDFTESLDTVNAAVSLVKSLSNHWLAVTDDDFGFVGGLTANDFGRLLQAVQTESPTISINNRTFNIKSGDNYIELFPINNPMLGLTIELNQNGYLSNLLKDAYEYDDPFSAWWDGWGAGTSWEMDATAQALANKFGLEPDEELGGQFIEVETPRHRKSKPKPSEQPENITIPPDYQIASPMHQTFENKLRLVLCI